MKEGTSRIGPSTPLPRVKKEEIQGSPTGVELFLEVEETTRGRTTEGCMVEELDGMELPTETRFIIIYYNRSSGKWTEKQDLQYDDGSSDDEGIDEDQYFDYGDFESSEEWSSRMARAACLAQVVALESTDMLAALTEVVERAVQADERRTKTYIQRTKAELADIQRIKAAELAETMVSLAEKANADESAKAAADGAKMVAAETQEQIAAEPRAMSAKDHVQTAVAPPKLMDADGRGIGGEAKALLALEALSEKMWAEASALTKAAKAAMESAANAAATAALLVRKAEAAEAEAETALAEAAKAEADAALAQAAVESMDIPSDLDGEDASGASSTEVEVGRRGAIGEPSTDGGKVASEQLISGDWLDNLSSSTAGRLKEDARTLVWHNIFTRSMDLTTLSTKEPGENENVNAGSEGNQAVTGEMVDDEKEGVAATYSQSEEVCKLRERVAFLEEKLGVAELDLEELTEAFSDVREDASLWRRQQKELEEDPQRKRAMLPFLPRKDDWICLACDWRNFGSAERCPKCGRPKSWYPIGPAGDDPSRGGGGGGWETEVAARMQGGWGDDEEEGFGSSWDRGGWEDEEAGEFDCGGWDRYS